MTILRAATDRVYGATEAAPIPLIAGRCRCSRTKTAARLRRISPHLQQHLSVLRRRRAPCWFVPQHSVAPTAASSNGWRASAWPSREKSSHRSLNAHQPSSFHSGALRFLYRKQSRRRRRSMDTAASSCHSSRSRTRTAFARASASRPLATAPDRPTRESHSRPSAASRRSADDVTRRYEVLVVAGRPESSERPVDEEDAAEDRGARY